MSTSYPVLDKAGVPVEAWVFLDPGRTTLSLCTSYATARRRHPRWRCRCFSADGAESCAQRMRSFVTGSPFARAGNVDGRARSRG